MVVQLWIDLRVLDTYLKRYKSNKLLYSKFYEKELYEKRFLPLQILQIGIENSVAVWHKYMQRSNIFCIDTFDKTEPRQHSYLKEKRIHWIRCDIDNEKAVKKVMKESWNNPRFDVIIDSSNNFGYSRYDLFRRFCVGKYYIEDGEDVKVMK